MWGRFLSLNLVYIFVSNSDNLFEILAKSRHIEGRDKFVHQTNEVMKLKLCLHDPIKAENRLTP